LSLLARAPYRIGQFGRALAPWVPARDLALAEAILAPAQLAAFRRMSPPDQRHAVRVARHLLATGLRDPDLLVAALLHDLGKVDAAGAGRVRLPHRVSKVVLIRLAPALWRRVSATDHAGPLHGFYLLRHHPALGAAWAGSLGVSPRSRALIAAHQDGGAAAEATEGVPTRDWGPTFARHLAYLREADDRL
jgi:hypothetical protein